jgi:DNA adenine methylase
MKPPVLYFGAKGSVADRIVQMMPEHQGYIEPFAGSLAVLLAKPECRMEIVNDLDGRLMTFWRVLRDRPRELAEVASMTPHSRGELGLSLDLNGIDELEVARRVWVSLTQGRSPVLGRKTGWRFFSDATKTSSAMSTYMNAYRERLLPAAERIRGVTLECRPALEVIQRFGNARTSLIYVDPPYLSSTRGVPSTHGFEMGEPDQHAELASALSGLSAAVMVSGYASPLYDDDLYRGWWRYELNAHTANSNGYRTRTEVVWSNRQLNAREMAA